MPRPSVRMTTVVKPGLLRSRRMEYRMSCTGRERGLGRTVVPTSGARLRPERSRGRNLHFAWVHDFDSLNVTSVGIKGCEEREISSCPSRPRDGLLVVARPEIAPAAAIAITHVTVVDVTGGPPRTESTVLVRGNRIASIGSSDSAAPTDARIVDGRGKYLIPG